MTTIAAFDFDETLTVSDSVVPFLRCFVSVPRAVARLSRRSFAVVAAVMRRDRDALRGLATAAVFSGCPISDVEDAAQPYGERIIAAGLRGDTVARLQWHLDAGHLVVIVSASYEHYVRVVAESFGEVAVVATRLEVDDAGRCTGRLVGANCRGPEKVVRLEQWLTDHGLRRGDVTLFAYGDSAGDRELLASADHPQWVTDPLTNVAPTV